MFGEHFPDVQAVRAEMSERDSSSEEFDDVTGDSPSEPCASSSDAGSVHMDSADSRGVREVPGLDLESPRSPSPFLGGSPRRRWSSRSSVSSPSYSVPSHVAYSPGSVSSAYFDPDDYEDFSSATSSSGFFEPSEPASSTDYVSSAAASDCSDQPQIYNISDTETTDASGAVSPIELIDLTTEDVTPGPSNSDCWDPELIDLTMLD